MRKLFVSLPMHGFSDKEIRFRMIRLREKAEEACDESFELIDTFMKDFKATGKHPRLDYLGDSIRLMRDADFIYFANNWSGANGCRIEMEIAKTYGIPYGIEDKDD